MDATLQDPLIGRLLDGRYRVEERIAVGGMATVYRAVDTRLDRVLALKVMHPALAADDAFVERFIREAKAAARLAHSNAVGVFDQGADGTYVYLAMEYVAGCTLRDVLRERGALQPRAALDILEPVLAALGAAHRAGLVHRDMKPENVLIGDDGRVKVADFGLARAVDTHTSTTGAVLGTVSYLAPEQIERGTADTAVDVYACGVTLYEMLTGHRPHSGGSAAQILYQHLHEDIPAPSDAVPGLAGELDALVARATARDPRRRPGNAVALLAEVRTTRKALSDDQLDAVPPLASATPKRPGSAEAGGRARTTGSEDPTSVIARPVAGGRAAHAAGSQGDGHDEQLARTSRLDLPPGPPPAHGGPLRRTLDHGRGPVRRRPLISLVIAVLLLFGLGTGAWYIGVGQFARTPGVLAMTRADAERTLEKAGLQTRVTLAHSENVQRGRVIESAPDPGDRIRKSGTVVITVSKGPRVVTVPELGGRSLAAARRELKDAGLTPVAPVWQFNDDVPRGSVIRTQPRAGEDRRPNSAVRLFVSRGLPIPVPDVIGMDEGEARQEVLDAGLRVEIAEKQVFSEHEPGKVAEQSVPEGEKAAKGDVITLTVSKGPDMVRVPDVEGLSEAAAREKLKASGFAVKVRKIFLGDTVFRQSTDGGDEAPRGSTISLWVR